MGQCKLQRQVLVKKISLYCVGFYTNDDKIRINEKLARQTRAIQKIFPRSKNQPLPVRCPVGDSSSDQSQKKTKSFLLLSLFSLGLVLLEIYHDELQSYRVSPHLFCYHQSHTCVQYFPTNSTSLE